LMSAVGHNLRISENHNVTMNQLVNLNSQEYVPISVRC
jgi:hypothetical protein